MTPLKRHPVNKKQSVNKFRKQSSRTNKRNIAPPPQRGGFRL